MHTRHRTSRDAAPLRVLGRLLPVLLAVWVVLAAVPASANPVDLVWKTVQDKEVHIELLSGAELDGKLIGWDASNAVLVRADGRIVTLLRANVDKVSLRQAQPAPRAPQASTRAPQEPTPAPQASTQAPQGQRSSAHSAESRAPESGEWAESEFQADFVEYKAGFAMTQNGDPKIAYLQTVSRSLASSDYELDEDRRDAVELQEGLERYLAAVRPRKTLYAVGEVGTWTFMGGAAVSVAGLIGTLLCRTDSDACALAPLLPPGIAIMSGGLAMRIPCSVGARVVSKRAIRIREELGFIARLAPLFEPRGGLLAQIDGLRQRPTPAGISLGISLRF